MINIQWTNSLLQKCKFIFMLCLSSSFSISFATCNNYTVFSWYQAHSEGTYVHVHQEMVRNRIRTYIMRRQHSNEKSMKICLKIMDQRPLILLSINWNCMPCGLFSNLVQISIAAKNKRREKHIRVNKSSWIYLVSCKTGFRQSMFYACWSNYLAN